MAVGLIPRVNTIEDTVENLDIRIQSIEQNCCNSLPTPEILVQSDCVIPVTPIEGVPLSTLVIELEHAFCELRSATGSPDAIFAAIVKQCAGLDSEPTLANPNTNMGSIPGWVIQSNYNDQADAINNIWLTICDLRAAVRNIQISCCPTGCEAVDITMTADFDGVDTITLHFTGSVPAGFQDCSPSGNQVKITDSFGNQRITNVQVISNLNNPTQPTVSKGTLIPSSNWNIVLSGCWENTSTNVRCERELTYTIVNSATCPVVTYATTDTTLDYDFNNTVNCTNYTIEVWNEAGTVIIASDTITCTPVGPVSGTISGLTASTTYKVRVVVNPGSGEIDCPFDTVTTQAFPPPIGFWIYQDGGDPGYFIQEPAGGKMFLE